MSGPTQPAKFNEEWSDERVKSWLDVQPYFDAPVAYTLLLRAYEAMPEGPFERFLNYFVETDFDINACNDDGQTFLDRVARHAQAGAYMDMLRAAGARTSAEL